MTLQDPDGSALLTSPEVGSLLSAAVQHAGGTLAEIGDGRPGVAAAGGRGFHARVVGMCVTPCSFW